MSIASNLKALGKADVIVVMKSPGEGKAAASGGIPASVARHFDRDGMTKDGPLLDVLNNSGRSFSTRAAAGRTSATSLGAVEASPRIERGRAD